MSWMRVYGLLLFTLTVINYVFGLLVHKIQTASLKRIVFIAGIAANLSALTLFKYTNFLLGSFKGMGEWLAQLQVVPANLQYLQDLPIILPLGISFFVFEFIHYLSDIFKGDKPIVSPMKFALFAAFFPSQIAGPIKRYQDFEKQEVDNAVFDRELFWSGILRISQGMFKKVALGDNLAPIVQVGFANPAQMSTFDAWLCMAAFSFQIYFDFSGYSDIAIGSARVLGFRLPENFSLPYLATSLRGFWRRWHISLSTWLRDYLYIPLGGSRKGNFRAHLNLIITMLLGGLWHGAAWHFVIWGAMHGTGLVVNHVWDSTIDRVALLKKASQSSWWQPLAILATFTVVSICFLMFRAANLPEALAFYHSMFNLQPSTTPDATISELAWQSTLPFSLAVYSIAFGLNKTFEKWKLFVPEAIRTSNYPVYARVVVLAGLALLILGLAPHSAIPFIYFQF